MFFSDISLVKYIISADIVDTVYLFSLVMSGKEYFITTDLVDLVARQNKTYILQQ